MNALDSSPLWQPAFDALRDAVFVVAADGCVLHANAAAARITGIATEDARGREFESLAPMFEPLRDHLARLRSRPTRETLEIESGGRWYYLAVDPIPGFGGLLFVLADVGERKRMVQALKSQNEELADLGRRKDHFLAMLAHELRNPLGALSNALHVLERRASRDDGGARMRHICRRQVENLARMVDDLIDVSRITRGAIPLRPEEADLCSVLDEVEQVQRPAFEERGLSFAVRRPAEPVTACVDRARIDQVLANLLANAAKFTPPGGEVEASLAVENGEAVFRVRDDGVGIRPENLARVFDLFVQVDAPLERATGGGLGVGLTLVRSVVELHGGTVLARSEGPGHGSEFVVRLPLVAEASREERRASPSRWRNGSSFS